MTIKLKNDSQLLDKDFRKKIIEQINSPANTYRKSQALRAYEILNGQTKKWVIESLRTEFDESTVAQMKNRATNISILRKVVSKLANTYTSGVTRKAEEGTDQKALDDTIAAIRMDVVQEKADKYLELSRLALVSCIPTCNYKESQESGTEKFDLYPKVIPSHLYDVIEDEDNPEIPRVVIFTEFVLAETDSKNYAGVGTDGRVNGETVGYTTNDGKVLSEPPVEFNRRYVFWSDRLHFTCDEDGEIIEESGLQAGDLKNPIEELPFVFYLQDQDGCFYPMNWEDRVDGSIHINVALTDMFCIAMVQGWGQPVLVGSKLPERVVGGPHNAINLKAENGEPEPKFYYASSNPPLDQWMRMVELDVALYLSTNNLSPTTVAAKLDVQSFPSGVAMMIERAESTADIQKKHKIFQDGEPQTVRKVSLWKQVLSPSNALTEKFQKLPDMNPDTVKFITQFIPPKAVVSEKEQMEVLKARKDLGLDTIVGLLMRDDPSLTEDQAKEKAAELKKEKAEAAKELAATMALDPNAKPGTGGGEGPPPLNNDNQPNKGDSNAV